MRKLLTTLALLALCLAGVLPKSAQAGGDVGYPPDAFALTSSSGNVANANAVATLTATAGRRVFLCGFSVMGAGATAAVTVAVTATGLTGGTSTFNYSVDTSVGVVRPPLQVAYAPCIPASADGTNIVVTLPALGAGNTNASAHAWGYIR